jgi:integrase
MLREHNVREGFFERDEAHCLAAELEPWLQPVFWFAYYTGWRRGEITSLQWPDIDLEGRVVRLRRAHAKSGRGRVVALEGVLWDLVVNQPRQGLWVFHREGRPITAFDWFWRQACKRAGLQGRRFHDLRRTAIRNLTRAGVPERVAMGVSGHLTRSIFDRYDIVSEGDIRDAMRRVTGLNPRDGG